MDAQTFKQYVQERYQNQVQWYSSRATLNKRLAYICQLVIIAFSAVIPVLASLNVREWTIVLSASVAVLVGIFNYCKFEDKWHNYRTTSETMKKEKHFFDTKVNGYEDAAEPEKIFVERIESLISREHTKWRSIVNDKEKKKKG